MFYLELTSGLRRGELLALLWSDVDTANNTISVSKQVIQVNGELKVLPPKTKNAVRKIVLPKQTVDLLIAEHSDTRIAHGYSPRRKQAVISTRQRWPGS